MGRCDLLVLGAGPAQLGVLAAARRRGLTVVAADRDPSAPGFRYADRRAIVSIEDEPAIDRLARAEEVDGIVAPGTDHAVAHRGPHRARGSACRTRCSRRRPRSPSPGSASASGSRRPASRSRARSSAAPPTRRRRPPPSSAIPVVVEAPDRRGERAVRLARTPDELAAATAGALAESRGDYCLVEELPGRAASP